jgi:hypothetical protein
VSRINVSQLQKPDQKEFEAPEINITPEGSFPMGEQQQQQAPQPTEESQHLKTISERLGQMIPQQDNGQQSQLLQQLTSDPVIHEYLQKKQAGQQVKLVDENQQQQPVEENEDDINWEELSQNPQKFAKHISRSASREVSKALVPLISGMMKKTNDTIQGLAQQVQQIGGVVQQHHQSQLKSEIDKVRDRNPEEFDRLRPAMADLAKQNPSLGFQDLYVLARTRAGLPVGFDQSIQSERPTQQTAARPPAQTGVHPGQQQMLNQPGNVLRNPRAQFDQTLASLLDKVQIG